MHRSGTNAVTYPKFYTTSLVALSVGFTHPLITVKVERRQKRLVNEAIWWKTIELWHNSKHFFSFNICWNLFSILKSANGSNWIYFDQVNTKSLLITGAEKL